jgi:hypothetical protein
MDPEDLDVDGNSIIMDLREVVWEGKIKVKLSLSFFVTKHHVMKAYWGRWA